MVIAGASDQREVGGEKRKRWTFLEEEDRGDLAIVPGKELVRGPRRRSEVGVDHAKGV